MKKTVICALVLSVVIFSGCDALRRLAGRPTSGELAERKAELAMEPASGRDSVADILPADSAVRDLPAKLSEGEGADSSAGASAVGNLKESLPDDPRVVSVRRVHGYEKDPLSKPFYIVLGAFVDPANANSLLDRVTKAGYDARITVFGNGYIAVAACESDSYAQVSSSMDRMSGESFCPEDAWILYNE